MAPSGPSLTDRPTLGMTSPPAVRTTASRWRDPRLALGVAVVALCSLLGAKVLASADDTVEVWAAASALDAGQQLTTADLVRREVRFADQADADRYLSTDTDVPDGSTLDRSVGTGELLARSAVSRNDADALTEVPLSLGTDAVPATLAVGGTVDVWVTPKQATSSAARASTLVFDDATVVAAPDPESSLGPTATRQVVVGVGAAQRSRLPRAIAALAGGDVTLTAQR